MAEWALSQKVLGEALRNVLRVLGVSEELLRVGSLGRRLRHVRLGSGHLSFFGVRVRVRLLSHLSSVARRHHLRVVVKGLRCGRQSRHEHGNGHRYVDATQSSGSRVNIVERIVRAHELIVVGLIGVGSRLRVLGTVVSAAWHQHFLGTVHGRAHELATGVQRVGELFGLAELYHALFEIVQRSFD